MKTTIDIIIKIFKNLGYEVTPDTKIRSLKNLGMMNVGLLGDEIEYELGIITTVADLKLMFKGTIKDMAAYLDKWIDERSLK
jgi:hypothetical protein